MREIEKRLREIQTEPALNCIISFMLAIKHQFAVAFAPLLLLVYFDPFADLGVNVRLLCILWLLLFDFEVPGRFKKSSSSFVMCILLACCEAIVLCFMSMPIDSKVFLIEVAIIIISLFNASLLAKCLRNKYKAKAGLMMALMTTAGLFILFFFLISSIRVWLTVCTL